MPEILARRAHSGFACLALVSLLGVARPVQAATLNWKGYDWKLTDGGMAGVADGKAANVTVDANGYLHLRIVKSGDTWTASEMFTVQKLGFGTYQWQIEGPIDVFDKQIVLGLFPYGPAAGIGGDGTNEIDIEFARWGQANGPNADFTDYPNSGNVVGETTFKFSLGGGTSATTRFTWTKDGIESSLLKGYQAVASDAELIKKWKYAPQNPGTNIPQQAMPLGMNLWCFGAPPTDSKNVEIVIRDFQFIKEGDPLPGEGGSGGGGGGGDGGTAGTGGGASGNGGTSSGGSGMTAGNANAGSTTGGNGGAASTGGNSTGGNNAGSTSDPAAGTTSHGGNLPAGGAASGGSSDTAGAPFVAGSSGSGSTASADDASGCSCRAAGSGASSASWWLAALLVLARRKNVQAGPQKSV
jgi:hypothetical protein